MDNRVVFTIIIVLLASLWYRIRGRTKAVTKSDPSDCKQILACTGYSSTESKNLYTLLESRAIPNERLVRAYDIDNAFTTSEDERYKKFNKDAGKSIAMTENDVGALWRGTSSRFHKNTMLVLISCSGKTLRPTQKISSQQSSIPRLFPHQMWLLLSKWRLSPQIRWSAQYISMSFSMCCTSRKICHGSKWTMRVYRPSLKRSTVYRLNPSGGRRQQSQTSVTSRTR